jgi:hypothetical protein
LSGSTSLPISSSLPEGSPQVVPIKACSVHLLNLGELATTAHPHQARKA